jgi:hypothetical protein
VSFKNYEGQIIGIWHVLIVSENMPAGIIRTSAHILPSAISNFQRICHAVAASSHPCNLGHILCCFV